MGNNIRGHRINATLTIYNNLASFVSTLSVSLEDGTPSPIISVSLLCQSTPYHIHSRDNTVLEVINLGSDGSNACEVAKIIFYLFIILLNDKGPRGTSSCDVSNPIAFEALEARA